MKASTTNEQDLRRIMIYGSSLGAGVALASLQALGPNFSFEVSFPTILTCVVGMALFIGYWRLIFSAKAGRGWTLARIVATWLVGVGGVLGFLYPVRFVAPNVYPDLVAGLVRAVLALTGGVVLMLSCKRFFDADSRDNALS